MRKRNEEAAPSTAAGKPGEASAKQSSPRPGAKSAAKYVAPCAVALVAIVFSLLLVYPIMKLSAHNVPIAICSLDEGASAMGADVNAGELLINQLTQQGDGSAQGSESLDADDSESGGMFSVGANSVAWTVFDSEDDMDQALERGDFYAAITVPEDFSQRMVAVKGREMLGEQLVAMLPSLAEGAAALSDGADALSQGASALAAGGAPAAAGSAALVGGLSQLSDGASALSGGLAEAQGVLDGLPEIADEAAEDGEGALASDSNSISASSLLGGADDSAAPFIELRINPSRNPMVSNSLQSAFSGLAGYGVTVRSSVTAEIPEELNSGYAHMPLLIMTYLASYAAGAVIAMLLKPKRVTRASMARGMLVQVAAAAAAAVIAGLAVAGIFKVAMAAPTDFVQLAVFLALCSFALQLVVVASLDLFGTPGMAVPLLLMALCMLCAYLPYEFLPDFWQNCIYPWNPLRYMVDGFKAILYTGAGAMNQATGVVAIVAAIGAAALALNMLKKPTGETK